jgi:hypothetical protein
MIVVGSALVIGGVVLGVAGKGSLRFDLMGGCIWAGLVAIFVGNKQLRRGKKSLEALRNSRLTEREA